MISNLIKKKKKMIYHKVMLTGALTQLLINKFRKKKKIIPFLWEIEKVVKILFAFIFFSHKKFSKMVY